MQSAKPMAALGFDLIAVSLFPSVDKPRYGTNLPQVVEKVTQSIRWTDCESDYSSSMFRFHKKTTKTTRKCFYLLFIPSYHFLYCILFLGDTLSSRFFFGYLIFIFMCISCKSNIYITHIML